MDICMPISYLILFDIKLPNSASQKMLQLTFPSSLQMAKSVRDWNSLTVILLWLGLYTVSLADDKTSAVLTDQLDPLRRTNRAENTSTVSARPITHTETNSNSPLFFSQYSPPSMKHIPVVSMSLHSEENKHVSHPSSVGFDELFPVCKNPCLNGGVCRETSQKLLKCICPADYKGEQCEICKYSTYLTGTSISSNQRLY